ncbi:DivIVA domain-containing protein [Actinoplanes sp. NPDC048988]|uniref:DivIVA domain-containing protein n=1 Tax=Actinoplanes sp. NPDC048988 TaxID=3363901 RepID=UPI00371FCAE7
MTLTPADIHNTEFAKASLGRRGYDDNDVDAFLDEAIGEMSRLLEENDALRTRLEAAVPPGDPGGRRRAAQAELSEVAAALDRAHRARDRAEGEARHVRQQLDEAHRSATAAAVGGEAFPERVMTMARHTADEHVRDAEERSRALLSEARERAGRTLHDAREMAAAIGREARHHRNLTAAAMLTDRERAVRDIDELTRSAAQQLSALHRHVRRQEQLIDGTSGR